MNVELLREVQKVILEEPKRFDMRTFAYRMDPKEERSPQCGTIGCIAGWAVILTHKIPRKPNAQMPNIGRPHGAEALDLTDVEALRLFYVEEWPDKFSVAYKADGSKKSAKVAVARINHFIKTKGME